MRCAVAQLRTMERRPGTIGPLTLIAPDGSFQAVVRDFTIAGAGFLSDVQCSPGTTLVIASGRLGKPEQPLSAEVRHATQSTDGNWVLGCAFSRYLTVSDLRSL
jgi:hypothetical protein